MPEQIFLPGGAIAFVPTPQEMSANQRYALLDPNVNTLDDYKVAKIAALDESCNTTILSGFSSDAYKDEMHQYPFDAEAQANFTGELASVNADPNLTEIDFKTLDAGYLVFTRDEFLHLCADGRQFKRDNIMKYNGLKQKVLAATSIDEVEAIVWS